MTRPSIPADARCTYCGTAATQWDHVVPASMLRPGKPHKFEADDWIVLACRDCNYMLHDKPFVNVPDRAKFLLKRYRQRFAKLLVNATWSDDEIEDLGPNLRVLVLETMKAQAEIDLRLASLRVIAAKPWDYLRP